MSFLNQSELESMGFLSLGDNVSISARASIYGASSISIGSNVRIDDFCVLSAGDQGIFLGDYIHFSVGVSLIGRGRISVGDFAGLSANCSVFSSSDDFSGRYLTNPTVPAIYTNTSDLPVNICRHSIIGANSVVLPGVTIGEGGAIGAGSVVRSSTAPWTIYAGTPIKRIKARSSELLELEKTLTGN